MQIKTDHHQPLHSNLNYTYPYFPKVLSYFLCYFAVPIHYDDHCRVCHRLGDLLCCETCPAVFHLECVDPPLVDVPSEDWQCALCKQHKTIGVTDCLPDAEKQGLLCRHEHLGFDRHGRKYWFIARRLIV